MNPYYLTSKPNDGLPVPCGKCPACLQRRISGWSFRLMQETKSCTSAYFITLTYDTNTVPISKNGFMDLSKRDVQLFIKRLRKSHVAYVVNQQKKYLETYEGISVSDYRDRINRAVRELPSIRYYVVGEYGGRFKRPHYHVIIYNVDLELMIGKKEVRVIELCGFDSKRQIKCDSWGKGFISLGTVDERSVGYCLKYMTKMPAFRRHDRDDRSKEFTLMSKGIGKRYLNQEMIAWHMQDVENRMYINLEGGKKAAMPRYYKNKIYGEELRSKIGSVVRSRMVEKDYNDMMKLTDEQRELLCRNYQEGVKAAFAKMYFDSEKNRINNF